MSASGDASDGPADETLVRAWQEVLAAEHAAVYAYGAVAGRLQRDTPLQRRAATAYAIHLQRRDAVAALVDGAGDVPVPSEVAYDLPSPLARAAVVRTLGQQVEDRCTVVHAAVVAAADGQARETAVGWLIDSSTRLLAWGGGASALPGFEQP